jgi:hypothetical protein
MAIELYSCKNENIRYNPGTSILHAFHVVMNISFRKELAPCTDSLSNSPLIWLKRCRRTPTIESYFICGLTVYKYNHRWTSHEWVLIGSTMISQYSHMLRARRPRFDSLQEQEIFVVSSVLTGFGAHPASYPVDTEGLYPGIERQGREAGHSPPCSAEVKNGGTVPPLPPYVFMTWYLMRN